MNEKKHAIDLEYLRTVIENDRDFEKELFAIFTENAQRNILKMEDAIKNNDENSWYMASHAFKGAAASIGAFDLSKALEYAQTHLRDGVEEKAEIIQKIRTELDAVLDFIKQELETI